MIAISDLLADAAARGVTLFIDGQGRLRFRARRGSMTAELKREIAAHQRAIIAALRAIGTPVGTNQAPPATSEVQFVARIAGESIGTAFLQPLHPLARFDPWDDTIGFDPGNPRDFPNGVTHKRADCTARGSWRHVWGGRFCSTCWPCTDPLAMVADPPPTATECPGRPIKEKNPIPI